MKSNKTNIRMSHEREQSYSNVDGLSLQNLFYVRNNYFPSCFMFKAEMKYTNTMLDADKILSILKEKYNDLYYVEYSYYNINTKKIDRIISVVIESINVHLRLEKYLVDTYILYGNDNLQSVEAIRDIFLENTIEPEIEKNNFYTVANTQAGFTLNKMKIKEVSDFDVKTHYNDDFASEDTKINDFINDDDKSGIVILHGGKGTGKTTYIRNLISKHPEKKFVFVPSGLIQMLGDPSFGNFLMTMENYVIVLEDCEDAIRSRKVSNNAGAVSLLLNMSDGLMSDSLGLKFICTFNEDIKNIDEALTRKGRLISKYEFQELSVKKTNDLLRTVFADKGEIPYSEKGLSLANIYGYYDKSYENDRKKVSF